MTASPSASTRTPHVAQPRPLTGAHSALTPASAGPPASPALVADVESAFGISTRPVPPPYGGLRYTAAWWAARENH